MSIRYGTRLLFAFCCAAALTPLCAARLWAAVTVPFDSGSAVPDQRALAALDALEEQAQDKSRAAVEIYGYADAAGSPAYNAQLSLRRAQAVRDALVERGWPAGRMTVRGLGPAPAAAGEAGRAGDRRVEVTALPDEPEARLEWFRGRVEYCSGASERCRPARKDAALYRLYKVRTQRGGAARLRFPDGSGVDVGGDSTLVIYGAAAAPTPDGQAADLELQTGELLNRLSDPQARAFRTVTPSASIAARSRAHLVSVSTAGLTTAAVYDGRAQVSGAGGEVGVEAGYGVSVASGAVPGKVARLPGPPEGFTHETLGLAPAGARVRIAWSGEGPLYDLELAADPEFSELVAQRGGEALPELTAELPYGRYWLRAASRTPDGLKSAYAVYSFDSAGPVFRRLAPAARRVYTSTAVFVVSGETVEGAAVSAGGVAAPAAGGRFTAEAPLALGENTVELRGETRRGPAETVAYRVLREPPFSRRSVWLGAAAGKALYVPELGGVSRLSRLWDLLLLGRLEDRPAPGGHMSGWAVLGGARYLPAGRARGSPYVCVLGGYGRSPAGGAGPEGSILGGVEAGWRFRLPGAACSLGGGVLFGKEAALSAGFRLELPLSYGE